MIVYQGRNTLAYLSGALVMLPREISWSLCPTFAGDFTFNTFGEYSKN
jgi:hypothetical protein